MARHRGAGTLPQSHLEAAWAADDADAAPSRSCSITVDHRTSDAPVGNCLRSGLPSSNALRAENDRLEQVAAGPSSSVLSAPALVAAKTTVRVRGPSSSASNKMRVPYFLFQDPPADAPGGRRSVDPAL